MSEMDGREVEEGVGNVCSEHETEDENCEGGARTADPVKMDLYP
jgi:hypothetical protein